MVYSKTETTFAKSRSRRSNLVMTKNGMEGEDASCMVTLAREQDDKKSDIMPVPWKYCWLRHATLKVVSEKFIKRHFFYFHDGVFAVPRLTLIDSGDGRKCGRFFCSRQHSLDEIFDILD